MTTAYLEDMIFKLLDNKLTDAEKRQLYSGYECEREIDEESEDEMKRMLYRYVLCNVSWRKIIDRLQADLLSEDEEEEEEED
jgi:hypothetical protein